MTVSKSRSDPRIQARRLRPGPHEDTTVTASANPSSSTTQTVTLPKSPEVARRHYLTKALGHRAALQQARATGANEAALAEIADDLADAKEMARRARSWGRRAAHRSSLIPPTVKAAGSRKRSRVTLATPVTARDAYVQPGTASVRDPYDPSSFITATVNRKVDLLSAERGQGRITEAQFLVGRTLQTMWEKQLGIRSSNPAWDSITASAGFASRNTTHGLAIEDIRMLGRLETARAVKATNDRAARVIGDAGVRFLRAILAEGHSFGSYAEVRGRGTSDRAGADMAKRFRWLLEELTEAYHTARAPGAAPIRDEYATQADAVEERLERSAALAAEQAEAEEESDLEMYAQFEREALASTD